MWQAIDGELVRMQHDGSALVVSVFRPMFGEAQAVLVRRLLDENPGTCSLARLVGQMAENHKVLTRDRYVAQWQPDRADEAHATFDSIAGRVGAEYVQRGVLLQSREAIIATGEEIIDSVNQFITHEQAEPTAPPVTWGELERAIHEMNGHYVRVGRLLKGGSYNEPIPYLPPTWKAAFRDGLFGEGAPSYEPRYYFETSDS